MDADARFRAKLDARANKTAPIFTDEPALPQGEDQAAVDARFQAKLARHGRPPAAVKPEAAKVDPEPKAQAKSNEPTKVDEAKVDPSAKPPEGKAEGERRR